MKDDGPADCGPHPQIMMTNANKKSLMRNLGEFVGHIWKGVKTDPRRKVIRRETQEEKRDDMILRRTTIEEIEIRNRQRK